MPRHVSPHILLAVALLLAPSLLLVGCGNNTPGLGDLGEGKVLAGTWTLKARIVDGRERPVDKRFMVLALRKDGTFQARYRGNSSQKWIRAGAGAFSYKPPLLTFFWDSGQVVELLVVDREPDQLRLHHGVNMVPLKDQTPDEIFVRTKSPKGPTSRPS